MAKFRGLETPGSPFPVVKGLPTSTCRLTTQPHHIMSCLVEIYKSWIRLWSALDSLCNVSSVNWFFFFFFWESCSGSFIHPDTATSCLCLHFVQLGRVIMDFINQHRIKRNILDSLLKILNFFFFCCWQTHPWYLQQQHLRFWFRGGTGTVSLWEADVQRWTWEVRPNTVS